jgi:tetratricopeptide (TPR) repeat protein
MNDVLIQRAEILMQQQRWPDAEPLLREALMSDPENAYLLAQLAEATMQQDNNKEALSIVNSAIALEPGDAGLFLLKARILLHNGDFKDAEFFVRQSIDLDAHSAGAFALWAFIKLHENKFRDALNLANESLQLDPGNLLALNTRSTALLKLNKKQESFNTIKGALKEDPNNPYTHSNYGWGLLETGQYTEALEHFREALKNDPGHESARNGMAEALKAKYIIYKLFLRYSFWISKLSRREQWFFIIGLYLLTLYTHSLSERDPEGINIYTPIYYLLFGLAFSTWVISPLSNLFLRLNPYGKYLLDEEDKMNANFVGGCFVLFFMGILLYFISGDEAYLALAGYGFLMTIPFSSFFTRSRHRNEMMIIVVVLAFTGFTGVATAFLTGEIFNWGIILFLVGLFFFQIRMNYLAIHR